ncbi:MAG TPA: hypothetical protein ENG91_02360 [Desulfobacteraceae bacterium]|nr:hypothetical protein [Desulfobacteraceae bacterium]
MGVPVRIQTIKTAILIYTSIVPEQKEREREFMYFFEKTICSAIVNLKEKARPCLQFVRFCGADNSTIKRPVFCSLAKK